jgi:hypothetical protein
VDKTVQTINTKPQAQNRPDINQHHIHRVFGIGSSGFLVDIEDFTKKVLNYLY